ncbi:MAG: hypothetical protein HEQ24_02180 [Dolichospermum sp. BR01]|nr:hypothetical protein [Dolichospermum sp. BR01]
MSEPYLLAASLLTGLVIPTSTIPQIPHLPEDSLSLLDLAQGFQSDDSAKISPHQMFTDINGNLRSELTTDGLHLSLAGYQVWQFALEQIEYRVGQIYIDICKLNVYLNC